MKHRALASLSLAIVLAGCAAYGWQQQAKQLSRTGNCNAARNLVVANEEDPGAQAAMFGLIYLDCDKNEAMGDRYFTLAARYGHAVSQQILVERGQPVPVADLQQRSSPSFAPSAPSGSINCTTIGLSRGDRITRCN